LSLDSTDKEAKDQLLEEIELMKSIGSHRNVVNMLGCWVKSDPIFLLLEYVPYGDLQHWLRKKRIQVSIFIWQALKIYSYYYKQNWEVIYSESNLQCSNNMLLGKNTIVPSVNVKVKLLVQQ